MVLVASRRYMNWYNVVFTPTGGTPIAIDGVTQVEFDDGTKLETFSADGDVYMTTVTNSENDPSVTVTSANAAALRSIPPNARGTLSATHGDARNRNASGGGALVYTMVNVVRENVSTSGAHKQYGSGSIKFQCESADGQTNPLSTSAA